MVFLHGKIMQDIFGVNVNENNVFSLDNTDDIPESCVKELRGLNIRDDTKSLLSLFDKKNRLSIDEIIVGLYRLYKLEKTRIWVSSTLYNLSRKNLVKKVEGSKGEYIKC